MDATSGLYSRKMETYEMAANDHDHHLSKGSRVTTLDKLTSKGSK